MRRSRRRPRGSSARRSVGLHSKISWRRAGEGLKINSRRDSDAGWPRRAWASSSIASASPTPTPREVVPAYRDVSAAVSDAARFRNEAETYAAEQHWSGRAEAQARRDAATARRHALASRAEGDRQAFLARSSAHAARPDLNEFRLLWDTFAIAYAGRNKFILDPRAGGRRHVWMGDIESLGLAKPGAPAMPSPPMLEPDD